MNVYQIALPHTTNASVEAPTFFNSTDYITYIERRRMWTTKVLNDAGGFTYLGERQGSWLANDGQLHDEVMHWYEVACYERETWNLLVLYAFQLFPDQKAIYTARVGECEIIEAPAVVGGE